MFSLPITNLNGHPMLLFDWRIHLGLIVDRYHKILTPIFRQSLTLPFFKFSCFFEALFESNFFALNIEQFED